MRGVEWFWMVLIPRTEKDVFSMVFTRIVNRWIFFDGDYPPSEEGPRSLTLDERAPNDFVIDPPDCFYALRFAILVLYSTPSALLVLYIVLYLVLYLVLY